MVKSMPILLSEIRQACRFAQQWGVCFLMSSLTFIVSFFCKFIPVPECKDKEFDEEKEIIINVDNEEKKLLSDEE